MVVWTILGSLSVGSILTLLVKTRFDHRTETRAARRTLYVELLTLFMAQRAYMKAAIYDPMAKPADVANDQVDRLNALLKIDATPAVLSRAQSCFELSNRFGLARSFGVPVDRDAQGFYVYGYEKVANLDDETRALVIRVSLAGIESDFDDAVGAVADLVRKELHGST